AMKAALANHDQIVRKMVQENRGELFKTTGDGFCAAFATASDAVTAAVATQRALAAYAPGATGPLRARMALHTGAAEIRHGDYFGPSLNRVARLLDIGHGGQVLLSQACFELVRDALRDDV